MKIKTSFLMLLLSAVSMLAQSNKFNLFFCSEVGAVSKYTYYDKDGKVEAYTEDKILAVNGVVGNGSLKFTSAFYDKNKEELGPDTDSLVTEFIMAKDGNKIVMNNLKFAMLAQDYVPKGDIASIPVDAKKGDKIADGGFTVKIKAIKSTVSVTDRNVTAEEIVETAAGKFDCIKIVENQTSTSFGVSQRFKVITWYSKNIGVVKQEVYKQKNNELLSSLVLSEQIL